MHVVEIDGETVARAQQKGAKVSLHLRHCLEWGCPSWLLIGLVLGVGIRPSALPQHGCFLYDSQT